MLLIERQHSRSNEESKWHEAQRRRADTEKVSKKQQGGQLSLISSEPGRPRGRKGWQTTFLEAGISPEAEQMGPLRYKTEGEVSDELNLNLGTEFSCPAATPTFLPNAVSSLAAALLLILGSEWGKYFTSRAPRRLQGSCRSHLWSDRVLLRSCCSETVLKHSAHVETCLT